MVGPPGYPVGRSLLKDQVVIVTASAGAGIGNAAAKRCIEEGATVVLSDLHETRLAEAAESFQGIFGEQPLAVRCDVTVEEDVQNLFESVVKTYGKVDVLINNAGLGGEVHLVDMADDEWFRILDVTLTGTMRCTRAALKKMTERGAGVIVNNASVLGWRAQTGQAHYAAAKAGVMALTRCVALEVAEYGVRVNCVAPSIAMHPYLASTSSEELLNELIRQEAFGRAAEPWEIANVMVFLASDLSSYMTGEVVSVSSQHP